MSTDLTAYQQVGDRFLPDNISRQKGNNTSRVLVRRERYDSKGNPQYLTTLDNQKIVILWGYNYRYSIAFIEGLTYSEVTAKVSESTISSIASGTAPTQAQLDNIRSSLSNALVSFTNKPLTLTHVHTSGSKSLTEAHTYSYDYADRLLKVQHKLDNNTIVTLAEYTYNDLGRVKQKKLGGTMHSSTYSYNIRSWLTHITGGKFTQTLTYNNGSTGYNGNTTAMDWTADGDSHSYTFTYDGLS